MAVDDRVQQQQPDAYREPRIWASSSRVYVSTPFKVTFSCGAAWMAEHDVSEALVRSQGAKAKVFLEGTVHLAEREGLPPCRRCCSKRMSNVSLGFAMRDDDEGSEAEAAQAEMPASGLRVVEFDNCRSHCNSSRLHLGGRVIVVLEVVNNAGEVVARPQTQPLMLCSKPTQHSPTAELPLTPTAPAATPTTAAAAAASAAFASQFVLSGAAGLPADSADDPLGRKLAELEATIYSQLVKIQFIKFMIHTR
eukprot:m51a1_g9593 hypothetical protein (251) ;mRNA; r:1028322-1029263